MAAEWREASVMDLQNQGVLLVEDGNHGEYRPRPDEFVDAGVAFIRAADIDGGRVLFESAAKINTRARQRITKGIGEPGDVLLSHKGTVGKVALVPQEAPAFVCSPQTTFWRTLDEGVLDRKYLYAFLRSPLFHAQLATRAGETDMAPYVSLTSQRGLSLALPPISAQRAIANVLGALDEKIDLNRRMSEALEAMARTVFKSWFVDFDPVGAKAEGRDPGLPKEIADLFPSRFVESELGEIPEGWRVNRFGEIAEQLRTPEDPSSSPDTIFHHFSLPSFDDGQKPLLELGKSVRSIKWRVSPGTVLISKLNPEIERVWLVDVGSQVPAICSTEFLVLRARPPFARTYVYSLARSEAFRRQIEGLVTGTSKSHQRAQVESILNISAAQPGAAAVAAFDQVAAPLLARALACRREGQTLAQLRDSLLPRLVSGELRVMDASKFIDGRAA